MLNPRHLLVIRAALRYWDEELSPHGTQAFADYVELPPGDEPLTETDTNYVRNMLEQCRLRYLICDESGTSAFDAKLFETPEAAGQAVLDPAATVATVLLFSQTG